MGVTSVLGIMNTGNLVAVLTIKYGKMLGKADLQISEMDNINILLALTLLLFAEMAFVGYGLPIKSHLVMILLIPTICEYLYVYRLFNRYMLYFHLPIERNRVIQAVGAVIACRLLLAYFYLSASTLALLIVPVLEVAVSAAFVFSSRTVLGHFAYINRQELPQWELAHFEEDIEIYKISKFHRQVNVYCSQALQTFILNGTIWIVAKYIYEKFSADKFEISFQVLSLASRVLPHSLILSNYLILYFRDKNYLRKDKTFVFEMKENLIKPGDQADSA